MATTNELQIIRSNPVNDWLVQAVFSTAATTGKVPFARLYNLPMYIVAKTLVFDLILVLQWQPTDSAVELVERDNDLVSMVRLKGSHWMFDLHSSMAG